jgi:hypothetical protein
VKIILSLECSPQFRLEKGPSLRQQAVNFKIAHKKELEKFILFGKFIC